MKREISGYLIVRKPEHNIAQGQNLVSIRPLLRLHSPIYAGVDRMPWFDLDEGHYATALTPEIESLYCKLSGQKLAWCDFRLFQDYQQAAIALAFLQQSNDKNEICAIHSGTRLDDVSEQKFDAKVQWLGVDIYVSGYGSAISNGIFARPDLFSDFTGEMNPHGLFDSTEEIFDQFRARWTHVPQDQDIEPMPDNEELWHQLLVGRVLDDN